MINAVIEKTEMDATETEGKRKYSKGETRRFALIFPLDLPGYVNVQYSKDCLSPYKLTKMTHPFQLGFVDTVAICRFLILHELDSMAGGAVAMESGMETSQESILVAEKGKESTITVAEFLKQEGI